MFQPMRPRVKWSRVENRFASKKGGSKDVDAVMPKARFLVTAAIAEIGYIVASDSHDALPRRPVRTGTYDGRIGHWPLSRSPDAIVE